MTKRHVSIGPPKGLSGKSAILIWTLATLLVVPELVLTLADWDLFGRTNLRNKVYYYGAYWPGLLRNWEPNFFGQTWLMHITYGFLHSGASHMVFNVLALFVLAGQVLDDIGRMNFIALYAISQIGGGLTFGVLTNNATPMVGASGALFGLVAAYVLIAWLRDRRMRVLLVPTGLLVLLNIVMYFQNDGLLAWEAHLGGFCFGAASYLVFCPVQFLSKSNQSSDGSDDKS